MPAHRAGCRAWGQVQRRNFLRRRAARAFERRWTRLLGFAAAKAFADTLVLGDSSGAGLGGVMSREPWLQDVAAESQWDEVT